LPWFRTTSTVLTIITLLYNMHSFTQSLFTFHALIFLCYLVSSVCSAPTGFHGSSLGLSKRHQYAASNRVFPYGKLSDRFLRVNDAYLESYLQSITPDASAGQAYIPQGHHFNYTTHAEHTQTHPDSLPKPTSNRIFLKSFVRWTSKALEKMQKVTSHLHWMISGSPTAGCKDRENPEEALPDRGVR